MSMDAPVVIEVDQSSVLLGWSAVKGTVGYELQMLTTPKVSEEEVTEELEWKSLSSSIQGTNIRKKNLVEGMIYHFRVRSKLPTGWDDFSPSSTDIEVLSEDTRQLAAPTLLSRDTTSVTVEWIPPDIAESNAIEISGYRLRYRAEEAIKWTYVDTTLKNNQVKKKGLSPGINYYFSVLPVVSVKSTTHVVKEEMPSGTDTTGSVFAADKVPCPNATYEYSPQSAPIRVIELSPFMANLFPKQLVSHDGMKKNTSDCLAGKMVALYFSAHWCGPCRQFTPVLGKVYQEMKAAGKCNKFEVVFCSAGQSESDFQSYFRSMAPWMAIDYDDDEREGFMGSFKVQGIPKLVILAPDGRLLTDNGVSPALSTNMVEHWLQQCNL